MARPKIELAKDPLFEAQLDMIGTDAHKPADDETRVTRCKTSVDSRAAIRADLAACLSQSEAARRNGVLAMTVSRLVRSA